MDGEVELMGERIAELAAHLDAAAHRLLADLREFDARGADEGVFASPQATEDSGG